MNEKRATAGRSVAIVEVLLIFALFFVLAGGRPPDVNEAHYLAKAKHYWNPQWCQGDLFLESADAHLAYYWSFGWLTRFLSLEATAWVGRCVTWLLLAWSWRRLSTAVVPGPLYSLLTAALGAMLIRVGHMAGEWLIGGVEAKGFAYVFVLLGFEALVRGRWSRMWGLFGAASAFHVLVGGWSVVAGLAAWCLTKSEKPAFRQMVPALLLGGALSLPGLVPGIVLSMGVDQETLREANSIYVHQRLAHHLLFHRILSQPIVLDFPYLGGEPVVLPLTHLFFVRHVALLLFGVGLVRFVKPDNAALRLYRFIAGAVLIAAVGIAIDQLTLQAEDLSAKLMRYYWFRLSDVMVPLGVAFASVRALSKLQETKRESAAWLLVAMLLLVIANTADIFARRMADPRPRAIAQSRGEEETAMESERRFRHWRQACRWIRRNTEETDIVLTPRRQQTFKWYAHRGEVVSWKDIPQDAAGVVEWKRRLEEIFPQEVLWYGLAAHGQDDLLRLAEEYNFRYVLVDRTRRRHRLGFVRVFPRFDEGDITYEVYRLPKRNNASRN